MRPHELVPIGTTALSFVGLQLILCSGRPKRALMGLFRSQRLKHTGSEPTEEELDRLATKTVIKLVNEVHNFIQVPLALAVMGQPEIKGSKLYGVTKLSRAVNGISAGFFLQDLAMVIRRYSTVGPEMLLHAAVCCPVYLYSSQAEMAHYYSSGFLLWELSTPFVHAREIMHQMGMGRTKAYKINGIAMMVVFFMCRNVYGPFFLVNFWRKSRQDLRGLSRDPRPPGKQLSHATAWTFRTGGVIMTCLNALWFSKMVQGAVKVFIKRSTA